MSPNRKKYVTTAIVQILTIALYAIVNFFVLKIEAVFLSPVKFILPLAILLLIADVIVTLFVLGNNAKPTEEEKNEQE